MEKKNDSHDLKKNVKAYMQNERDISGPEMLMQFWNTESGWCLLNGQATEEKKAAWTTV